MTKTKNKKKEMKKIDNIWYVAIVGIIAIVVLSFGFFIHGTNTKSNTAGELIKYDSPLNDPDAKPIGWNSDEYLRDGLTPPDDNFYGHDPVGDGLTEPGGDLDTHNPVGTSNNDSTPPPINVTSPSGDPNATPINATPFDPKLIDLINDDYFVIEFYCAANEHSRDLYCAIRNKVDKGDEWFLNYVTDEWLEIARIWTINQLRS